MGPLNRLGGHLQLLFWYRQTQYQRVWGQISDGIGFRMTKSTGVGRGGRRPGAGRKPSRKSTEEAVAPPARAKRTPAPKKTPSTTAPAKPAEKPKAKRPARKAAPPAAPLLTAPTEADLLDAVKAGCLAAVNALIAVAEKGSDSARVQAAEKLLKWGFGSPKEVSERGRAAKAVEPKPAREPVLGKKEQRQQAAQKSAVGKFAPPSPPRLAVDNT
ncbi:hypothetical protein V5F34_08515 [Xanthobacter autotrophicus]|uniref:hypothetical protein n=1 Tax=Xanthobacter autotrophicus TaxID=280 RepID=UPI00372C1941